MLLTTTTTRTEVAGKELFGKRRADSDGRHAEGATQLDEGAPELPNLLGNDLLRRSQQERASHAFAHHHGGASQKYCQHSRSEALLLAPAARTTSSRPCLRP